MTAKRPGTRRRRLRPWCTNCGFKRSTPDSEFCSDYCKDKWANRNELNKTKQIWLGEFDAAPWPGRSMWDVVVDPIGPRQFRPIPGVDDVPAARRLESVREHLQALGTSGQILAGLEPADDWGDDD